MKLLSMARALDLPPRGIISFYGAGGKTSLMDALGGELLSLGFRVVVTTTTKMFEPRGMKGVITGSFDAALQGLAELLPVERRVYLARGLLPGSKLQGVPPGWVERLFLTLSDRGACDYFLVEADGAAGMPVKGYAAYEPVLPEASGVIIPVLGADALGLKLATGKVHRPQKLKDLLGLDPGSILSEESIIAVLEQMVRLGEKQAPFARIAAVINKADLMPEAKTVLKLAGLMKQAAKKPSCLLFTVARQENPVRFVFSLAAEEGERKGLTLVSCIVLAAGGSSRMGVDKLSLPLKQSTVLGETLRHVAEAGFKEIILVAQPGYAPPAGLPVLPGRVDKIVENSRWRTGLSSSLKAGLAAVSPLSQGALFMLADQPFIPGKVLDALIASYNLHLNQVTYPVWRGREGNPVLFDRRTWPLLMALEGDRGGRSILDRVPAAEILGVETACPGILQDIDTPADYKKLARRDYQA
ncbi:MAG TPA: putative selenium-dependent hydroxylase accessory protein YqeC [Firmicutes bacterium]|nr:putative selenium-dependent hydroxylase accessory protein YqeC [Bacillota bacterium]